MESSAPEIPTSRLEDFLEREEAAPFYDLLGGLADNVMTIGGFAGSFLSCDDCGTTFSLRESSWGCGSCGRDFELKFEAARNSSKGPYYPVRAKGLRKPGAGNPHWYFADENWTVAAFLLQLLRMPAEVSIPAWLQALRLPIKCADILQSLLCWPRLAFGPRTIQPDLALALDSTLVFVEFKRPDGGTVPPLEIMGQIAFAEMAAQRLARPWHLVIVPGNERKQRLTASEYCEAALNTMETARDKWNIPNGIEQRLVLRNPEQLSSSITVVSWEDCLRAAVSGLESACQPSWSRERAIAGIRYFWHERIRLGLLVPTPSQ